MFKPFADSARALATGPLTWKAWTGLIAVPLLVAGLLTWAYWSPADHGTAKAAVVNHDEPVTVEGRTVPLGRELAGNLTHSEDSPYEWVLTDDADAAAGLADGTYAAVVTIPENFSAQATTTATAAPLDAAQAVLTIATSAASGVADPALSSSIAETTQQTLDQQVVETYLDNVYIAFTTIHDQLNQAADGAAELADGTARLRSGAAELSTGADELAEGTGQLADGSSRLADGLTQAEQDTAQLPELTRRLAEGAEQVADGNEELADTVVPLANRIIDAIDALPSAAEAAAEFQDLAGDCSAGGGDGRFCDALADAADRFTSDADAIDGAKDAIRAAAVSVRDSVTALAEGARQVADGNAALAVGAAELTAGIADAADGARQLSDGAQQADDGARQLADGAGELSDGAVQVDDGAQELATQLDKGREQVPGYTEDERAHLTAVAADPTTATVDAPAFRTLAVTLFAALALWALALATYVVTRAVPGSVLTARAPTWRIILRAAVPGTTAAGLAAAAITAIAAPALRLGVAGTLGFLAVALLAAGAFVAVNQAAVAILGRAGRLLSITVLVLGVATGVVSTLPAPLHEIAGYLPTHGAVLALRAVVDGGPGLTTGIVELAVWLAIGTLATILVTDRRRYLSPRRLRLGAPSPASG